ncbi:MAG: hypothetical protein Fur0022_01130 [Anaerolineales bacterium]
MSSQEAPQLTFLFADLSGFTALTETHGDDDAADIVARLYELAQGALEGEARFVKTIGDAVMIVAAEAAPVVLTALRLLAAAQQEPGFPALRAGLHLGPCVERAGDYIGATVNLAARITAYARSDQILCTEAVVNAIRPLEIAAIRAVGSAQFKNVTQPVALFEIEDPRHPAAPSDTDPVCRMRLDPERTLARLPYGDHVYHFCSFNCAQKFAQAPEMYVMKRQI